MPIAEKICFIGKRPKKVSISTELRISIAVDRLERSTKAAITPTGIHRGKIVSLKESFLP